MILEIAAFIVSINLLAGLFMSYDKWSAMRGGWRVPEVNLYLLALLGATPMIYFLIYYLRHKSSKASFKRMIHLAQLGQLVLIGWWLVSVAWA